MRRRDGEEDARSSSATRNDGEDGGARCRSAMEGCSGAKMVVADVVQWCPVAGELGGGGCVESGRETRVRVSCVRWRR